jgi:hypothetical protein
VQLSEVWIRNYTGSVSYPVKVAPLHPSKYGNVQGKCFHIYWPQGQNRYRALVQSSPSAGLSFLNPFPRSQSVSPKHPPRVSLPLPLGRIPNGMRLGWRNSVTAKASASDSTLASASQANNAVMRTNAQWRKRMGRLVGDSILPQGIRSRHTDLVYPRQCPLHVIQRSYLQNFYHRLWLQSPRHRTRCLLACQ